MERTPERHQFVSDSLGLPGFPVGTEPSSDMGDHVMGVVVIAWLTRHPLERWGLAWAESGSIEARFRAQPCFGVPRHASRSLRVAPMWRMAPA